MSDQPENEIRRQDANNARGASAADLGAAVGTATGVPVAADGFAFRVLSTEQTERWLITQPHAGSDPRRVLSVHALDESG